MTILERIDGATCGCDAPAAAKGLLSIDAALARIGAAAGCVAAETETVPLARAKGRLLAQPVTARGNVPPFDNAAMDGYALNVADLSGDGPWHVEVASRIPAGGAETRLAPGTASRIFTGAPLPVGATAVVMQEEVTRDGDTICIARRPTAGQNVRRTGEDMRAGAELLPAGCRIGAREIAVCAAAGQASVDLRRPLRVTLLVTGNEVKAPGQGLGSGQIWDVNTPMLTACLAGPSVDTVTVEHGADSALAMRAQLARLACEADLIVTTGGISVGEEDHVKPAFAALGGTLHFSGVAIKPGKPVSFGTLGNACWLGLPGNPLSAFVTWQVFGTALLRRLSGSNEDPPARRHVTLGAPVRRKPGRCELRPARLAGFDAAGREVALFESATHSARVARLPDADGLLFLPADAEALPEGALVEFLPFRDM